MRRILTCLLLASVWLALPVRADILWEPRDNSFYEQHRDDCEYVGRVFYANGEEGFITLWDAPGGKTVISQFENGEKLRIYYTYQNWGLVNLWPEKDLSGWVPLEDLKLIYDHISFSQDYAGQIQAYQGEFADYREDLTRVNFYEYPGAPEVKLESTAWKEMQSLLTEEAISQIFVDEEDRIWGYVDYLYGRVEGWFCLDDPAGEEFPVRQVSEATLTPPQAPKLPVSAYTPYILVGGAAAVTGVLLFWFYGRKRAGQER